MRFVAQRVEEAQVDVVDGGARERVGAIGPGLLVYLGVAQADDVADAEKVAAKLLNLRVFEDDAGKMSRAVRDVGGSLLVVSQFTLFGDIRRGNRPSFTGAGAPELGERLYRQVVEILRRDVTVATGRFGADMRVCSVGQGPVTILFDTRENKP